MTSRSTCFVPISALAITTFSLVAARLARSSQMFSPQSQSLPLSPQSSYPPLINIGCGEDITIRALAELVAEGGL